MKGIPTMSKSFFSKLKKSKDAFEEGRKGRTGGMVQLQTGPAIVRLQSVDLDVNDDKQPYVQFNTVCVSSENEDDIGQTASQRVVIRELKGTSKKTGKPYHITIAECFAQICTILQKFGFETEEIELEELAEIAEAAAEEQPACSIEVVEKGEYLNILFKKQIDDDDLPSIDDVFEAEEEDDDDDSDEEESEDDDEEEIDEEEDGDDEDEEEPYVPSKGDTVSAKPPKTKKYEDYTVKTVSKAKETCTLVRDRDDKEFKNVPWDVINEADEDEDE